MSAEEIDAYLAGVPRAQRDVLSSLRTTIRRLVPDAEEEISYRIPAFRVDGGIVAGFAAFRHHLSYFPFSGSVLGQLVDELSPFPQTKSSLHFTIENPLSEVLVERLIALRRSEILDRGH